MTEKKKDYIYLLIRKLVPMDARTFNKFKRYRASRISYIPMPRNALKVSTKGCPYNPAQLAELIHTLFGDGWYGISIHKKSFYYRKKKNQKMFVWLLVDEWQVTSYERNGVRYVACKWQPNPYRKNRRRKARTHSLSRVRWMKGTKGSIVYWFCSGKKTEKPYTNDWVLAETKLSNGDVVDVWELEGGDL